MEVGEEGDYIPIDTPEVTLGDSCMTTDVASASKKNNNPFQSRRKSFFYPRRTRLVCNVRVTSECVLRRYGDDEVMLNVLGCQMTY